MLGERGESAVEDTRQPLGWVTCALPTLIVLPCAVPRLAMRAAFGLPYEKLLPHTPDPVGALADGDDEPLLAALFEELGLRPPDSLEPR